jgi:two-component system phosphate regulon sensor histidine kinase PhoR
MKKHWLSTVLVIFGLAIPTGVLVYGWAYASIRENRLKERIVRDMEARGDPEAAYERQYMEKHRVLEMIGLAALCALLVATGATTLRAARRSRELAEKKTAFVAAVTHELRTPLTTLRMHAEMLDQGLVTDDRKARVYRELAAESERLARLVENVLAMSKLEEGRWVLERRRSDLSKTVADVARAMEPRANELGFSLVIDAPPIETSFDARAVELAVGNLIDNALKYAAGHEPKRIELAVARSNGHVEVRVRDHGPGIASADRERIFERFTRVATDGEGVGVGLSLVRDLARAHGGDACVVSSDSGLAIALTLPEGE